MANDKPKQPEIREPYYKIQDGLWELRDVLLGIEDSELRAQILEIHESVFRFEKELTKKYNWD